MLQRGGQKWKLGLYTKWLFQARSQRRGDTFACLLSFPPSPHWGVGGREGGRANKQKHSLSSRAPPAEPAQGARTVGTGPESCPSFMSGQTALVLPQNLIPLLGRAPSLLSCLSLPMKHDQWKITRPGALTWQPPGFLIISENIWDPITSIPRIPTSLQITRYI